MFLFEEKMQEKSDKKNCQKGMPATNPKNIDYPIVLGIKLFWIAEFALFNQSFHSTVWIVPILVELSFALR